MLIIYPIWLIPSSATNSNIGSVVFFTLSMTSDIILLRDDFVLNSRDTDGKLNKVGSLQNILETYVSKYIIRKLNISLLIKKYYYLLYQKV